MKTHITKYFHRCTIIVSILFLIALDSCKKVSDIAPPASTVTASKIFSTDTLAQSAAAGMYFQLANGQGSSFSSGATTILSGLSADELITYDQVFADQYVQFQDNKMTVSSNGLFLSQLWAPAFAGIYNANSILDGLNSSPKISDRVRNELTGEAEFIRAFCNFYLVNLFGGIPIVTTINYHKTSLLPTASVAQVYAAITADLLDAQGRLPVDYSAGHGQRIVPNKWAATALLARVYLFNKDYKNAELQATLIINNSALFSLTALNSIFLINSNEAIWQLQQSNNVFPWNVPPEGFEFIPYDSTQEAPFYLTNSLLSSFTAGDQRKKAWIDSTNFNGKTYYYPFKYKVGISQASPGGQYLEYNTVLRLAEQYLIRAEAEANGAGSGISAAVSDLNMIRSRAGLPDYQGATTQEAVLNEIWHEDQIEFFAEFGHRWLDLKRTGRAISVLSEDKGFLVTNNSLLYPIPLTDISTDPNLKQNPGY